MRRVAPAVPVPPKVFKHFAVLTMAITACVAIFADGEGSEAIAAQLKERQAKNALIVAEVAKTGARHVNAAKLTLRKDKQAFMPFAPDSLDESGSFGAPMDTAGGSNAGGGGQLSGGSKSQFAGAIVTGPDLSGPGSGPQGRLVNPGSRSNQTPPRPTQQQLNSLQNASRLRSGG